MDDAKPYLSVVVTSRNDDHGGTMLRRMQTFVNALIAQCKRFNLPAELIVVEWNPPADRGPLSEALRWPEDTGPLQVRFIVVPTELHAKVAHSQALPLFQMIAKNVGIRRARGEYILATNIDILFNDELMQFLADRKLQPGKMYRIDRHDADTYVPVDAPVEEQLEYCRTHLVRVNRRGITVPLLPDGRPAQIEFDIPGPGCDVRLGSGWFAPERYGDRPMRWLASRGLITISQPSPELRVLAVDIDLHTDGTEIQGTLELWTNTGELIGRMPILGQQSAYFTLPAREATYELRCHAPPVDYPLDPRELVCRVFRCELVNSIPDNATTGEGQCAYRPLGSVNVQDIVSVDQGIAFGSRFFSPENAEGKSFRWFGENAILAVRPPDPKKPVLKLFVEFGPGTMGQRARLRIYDDRGKRVARVPHRPRQTVYLRVAPGVTSLKLVTRGGGVKPPGVHCVLNGRILGAKWARRSSLVGLALLKASRFIRQQTGRAKRALQYLLTLRWAVGKAEPATTQSKPVESNAELPPFPPVSAHKALFLHTNACGDFTLMHARHWEDIRGYPEFEIFSMNIDSLGCYTAHHAGAVEEVLPEPMRIYHIEHGVGSGWTPEGESTLRARLAGKGLPWMENDVVLQLAVEMRRFELPIIFNNASWGFGDAQLEERCHADFGRGRVAQRQAA